MKGDGDETQTHHHTCPLCEACCNLRIETQGREVKSVRGDNEDPFSRGYLCPKGALIGELDADPDRLRRPLLRTGNRFDEISWEDAFGEVERRLSPILAEHGREAAAVYLGNPSAHHMAMGLYSRVLVRALATRHVFSASTVDQMPKQIAVGLVFGQALSVPVPDIDRTMHLVVMGANPIVSNGSFMTAADVRERLRAIRSRGGRIVVIDPKRTRTAEEADEHVFIRPGTDAFLLLAWVHTLFTEGLTAPGRLTDFINGIERLEDWARPFSPEAVAPICGIEPTEIRRLLRDMAAAPSAAIYGRIGTCTQEFGTAASWLVDAINALTGNLDRAGGAMFPKAAAGAGNTMGASGRGRGLKLGRFRSRVRGAPEALGELPAACLAEEIDTEGEGRIRALFTIAGNPVLSTPNGRRLRAALPKLDLMVSLDIYRNETTRHADIILPGLGALEQSHYPIAFTQLAVRNFARYSPAVFPPPEGAMEDWRILLRLAAIASGQGPNADIDAFDDLVCEQLLEKALGSEHSPIHGRDPIEIRGLLSARRGPERLLDLQLRTGPYGDAFGARDGLTLAELAANPHAVDLGPLLPRLPEALRTPSGRIELAPPELKAEVERLAARLEICGGNGAASAASGPTRVAGAQPSQATESGSDPTFQPGMVLIGRRDLRSNNSWMHNVPGLVSGRDRCTLQIHPDDATRLGLDDGARARIRSRVGEVVARIETTTALMPGVASLPHGFGHDDASAGLSVAGAHAGVCSNDLTDESVTDPLSGNAILCGIPIEITPDTTDTLR